MPLKRLEVGFVYHFSSELHFITGLRMLIVLVLQRCLTPDVLRHIHSASVDGDQECFMYLLNAININKDFLL